MSTLQSKPLPFDTKSFPVPDLHFVREYPHSRSKVWRVLTDPDLMALWGMRPEGFAPVVGTKYRLIGKANAAWRGFVECEVLEVREREHLVYSWNDNGDKTLLVKNTLSDTKDGTRLVVVQSGFTGLGGLLFRTLIMGMGLRATLSREIPRVLAQLQDDGSLRPGTKLKPKFE